MQLSPGVMSPALFVPFAILHMKQPISLDYLWGTPCIVGAVCFVSHG
jgi:uncharacterized protein (DUF486 family)